MNTRHSSGACNLNCCQYVSLMNTILDSQSQERIYLIDDDESFRSSLANALQIMGYDVAAFSNVESFLSTTPSEKAVLICDMRMPGQSGLDLQMQLKIRNITLPLIFVSGESSVHQAVEAMKCGASDFIIKPFEPAKLFEAVKKAFREHQKRLNISEAVKHLSKRETEAFRYIIEGFGNAYIAEKMTIRISTLKEYKTNIFKKLNVSNISELIERYKVG